MPPASALHLHRYDSPATWAGYLEPRDRSWILFVDTRGRCRFYISRSDTGEALPPAAPCGEVLQ